MSSPFTIYPIPSTPFDPSTLPSFDKFIEAAAAFAETLKEQIPRKRKTNRKQPEKVAIKEDSSSSSCILLVVGMDCWVFHDSLRDVWRSESTSIKTATNKISQSRIWMLFSRHNCLGWGHHPRIIHEHHFIWYDFVSTKQIKSWIKNSSICTSNGHSVSLSVMPTDIWSNFIYSPKTAISTTMGISTELDKETTQEHLSFCATYGYVFSWLFIQLSRGVPSYPTTSSKLLPLDFIIQVTSPSRAENAQVFLL